jgi:DNA-binding PadR family transcriptional regulator
MLAVAAKRGKKTLTLMRRDIEALQQLSLHRAMTSSQFAALCFHNCGYETARKRVRKLMQHGYLGVTSRRHSQGRGRPEQLYFITETGAAALKEKFGTAEDSAISGVPHPYLKDHCLRVAEIHLAMLKAEKAGIIKELEWTAGWQLCADRNENQSDKPDAIVRFKTKREHKKVAIIVDTGNLRQTRHWEPKLHFLLKTVPEVWIITGNTARILTLRKWSLPIMETYGVEPVHCIFAVCEDLVNEGMFHARWVDVHGNAVNS